MKHAVIAGFPGEFPRLLRQYPGASATIEKQSA